MRHGVGHVDKEGTVFAPFDKLDGFICIAASQLAHVGIHLDDRFIANKVRLTIVAAGCAEEIIKALMSGH